MVITYKKYRTQKEYHVHTRHCACHLIFSLSSTSLFPFQTKAVNVVTQYSFYLNFLFRSSLRLLMW